MPISLSTVTGFVPCATLYFREGKVWVFGAGMSRLDAISKQVVLKCLCGWVLSSTFPLAEDLAGGLCAFHLCYKEITSQQSNNVKVLTGTPKFILAIPLAIWYGWGNRLVQMKSNSVVFYTTFESAEELSQVYIAAAWTSRELKAKGKRGVKHHIICFSLNKQYAQVSHSALSLGAKSQCLLVNTFFPLSRAISLFSVTIWNFKIFFTILFFAKCCLNQIWHIHMVT